MNFELVRDSDTHTIHVMNPGTMFDFDTRMQLRPTSKEHTSRVEGDQVFLVKKMELILRVNKADENQARVEIDKIMGFLEDAEHIKRVTTGRRIYWRALNTPCVKKARATPLAANRSDWALSLTLLPRFPRWTEGKTDTLGQYGLEAVL